MTTLSGGANLIDYVFELQPQAVSYEMGFETVKFRDTAPWPPSVELTSILCTYIGFFPIGGWCNNAWYFSGVSKASAIRSTSFGR